MRVLGLELSGPRPSGRSDGHTLVRLDEAGAVDRRRRADSIPAAAAAVAEWAEDGPFLLGVDVPVVVPARASRHRAVENVVRRRLGSRLPPGGRGATSTEGGGPSGEALMAGLAAAGHPCLPWPDRERRRSGLAETHPGLALKALLWEQTGMAERHGGRPEVFRALDPAPYRRHAMSGRATWADQVAAVESTLALLGRPDGFDLEAVAEALGEADDDGGAARAAALLDAVLIAGAARRYLLAPEESVFLGERDAGYLVLPADEAIRRFALGEPRPQHRALFPRASLRERLGQGAKVRQMDLLDVPGRPQRVEARFDEPPRFEFDNVDEMLWWKHCRQLSGAALPTEGLTELRVTLDGTDPAGARLGLARSRHRTLSFRFDPPAAWRAHVPPRDGRTYRFVVLSAVYETLA